MSGPRDVAHVETRLSLHRVAAHVVARARFSATGRFGLRPCPGGFGTPDFGPEPSRVRVVGDTIVHERASSTPATRVMRFGGASLADVARFVGVELDGGFAVGRDTPPLGDVDAALRIDPVAARLLGDWFDLSARALDRVVAAVPEWAAPTVAQLWPEHFDLGLDVGFDATFVSDRRANLGASPGDGFHAEPYLYVGPWTADRPGDLTFWNAPFGAVLGADEVLRSDDPVDAASRFLLDGLARLGA